MWSSARDWWRPGRGVRLGTACLSLRSGELVTLSHLLPPSLCLSSQAERSADTRRCRCSVCVPWTSSSSSLSPWRRTIASFSALPHVHHRDPTSGVDDDVLISPPRDIAWIRHLPPVLGRPRGAYERIARGHQTSSTPTVVTTCSRDRHSIAAEHKQGLSGPPPPPTTFSH